MSASTFEICPAAAAIRCLVCGLLSHNANDVAQRYCGRCHRFHRDPCAEPTEREIFIAVFRYLIAWDLGVDEERLELDVHSRQDKVLLAVDLDGAELAGEQLATVEALLSSFGSPRGASPRG